MVKRVDVDRGLRMRGSGGHGGSHAAGILRRSLGTRGGMESKGTSGDRWVTWTGAVDERFWTIIRFHTTNIVFKNPVISHDFAKRCRLIMQRSVEKSLFYQPVGRMDAEECFGHDTEQCLQAYIPIVLPVFFNTRKILISVKRKNII